MEVPRKQAWARQRARVKSAILPVAITALAILSPLYGGLVCGENASGQHFSSQRCLREPDRRHEKCSSGHIRDEQWQLEHAHFQTHNHGDEFG